MRRKCLPHRISYKSCPRLRLGLRGRILGCQGYVKRLIETPGGSISVCLYDPLDPAVHIPLLPTPAPGGRP